MFTVLISSTKHPVYERLLDWGKAKVYTDQSLATGGKILFLISYGEKVFKELRDKYEHTLVVHASDLPKGRGWSPHIWQILEGERSVKVSLLEADDKIDSGNIWAQETIELDGHELYDEINDKLFDATISLMDRAISGNVEIRKQSGTPTYYPKRSPDDSRLDANKSIADCFEHLRVADPNRFPCFFEHRGHKYKITIEKV